MEMKHKQWLEYMEKFAKWRQRYHRRRARIHPEEYPDYRKGRIR